MTDFLLQHHIGIVPQALLAETVNSTEPLDYHHYKCADGSIVDLYTLRPKNEE